jgi:hypothetical protein
MQLKSISPEHQRAVPAITGRKNSSEPGVAKDWAAAVAKPRQGGAETATQTAASVPGGSANLHAERRAIEKVCEAIDAKYYQTNGFYTGKSVKDKGYRIAGLFTELPPCPACQAWLQALENGQDAKLRVRFIDELEDYWDKKDYQRKKQFDSYIEGVI